MVKSFPPLKTRFIVNPRSGAAIGALPAIRAFATKHSAEVDLTERPRHACELATRALADSCELIVAVGGDGTMNEVASVLIGTPATLGLIPCGSGDGLGRHLGIHGSVAHALGILHRGRPALIDTGKADGHPFFTTAGLGFEAEIAQRFNQLQRRGFVRYVTTIAKTFRRWSCQNYTVTCNNQSETFRAFTLVVANAGQYGNNAHIAPSARVDDGLLDLCAIPPLGWNALSLAVRLFHGTINRVAGVRVLHSDRFTVERGAPGPLHTDGEVYLAGTKIEFRIYPASLRVMVPD